MKKIAIIYGNDHTALMKKAVETLSKVLLDYTFAYPVCFAYENGRDYAQYRCIYIGTKNSNSYIAQKSKVHLTEAESYSIFVQEDTVIIEGHDDAGVLYGCVDFYNKYIVKHEFTNNDRRYFINIFENQLPDFSYTSAPSVKNRGIWSWGHVIYDYKDFLDNMLMLKMNTLIIWNDSAPYNAKEVIEYAHSCGIKIIFGFAWGWDTKCNAIDLDTLEARSKDIFATFEREYAHQQIDGIYFQSFTELNTEYIGQTLIAQAVTDFVNKTAGLFYEKYPDLELQFGLHATSVKNKLEFIKQTDPRIRIVWENCGAFPFSYCPNDIENFAETKAFTENIAELRGSNDKFGVVTKGFTKLDWSAFEHLEGPVSIGACSDLMKENRIIRKRKIWKYLQAHWLTNADKALEIVKTMAHRKQGDLYVTALVEDGMFEENIMYPVALYAEMLWDCEASVEELISDVALRSYVTFA